MLGTNEKKPRGLSMRRRGKLQTVANFVLPSLCLVLFLSSCNLSTNETAKSLRNDMNIIMNVDFEKMLLGNMTADYVGNSRCAERCHTHDKIRQDFAGSTMGAQLTASSAGMAMAVNCESCHGPASTLLNDVKDLDEKKDREKIKALMKKHLLDMDELPAGARSLICLKCHTTNSSFNLHNWNTSVHALSEVSCSNCHSIHGGADLITPPRKVLQMCTNCHQDVAADFSMPSHHPVKEEQMYCTDCHEPHGNANNRILIGMTVKETCCRCHTEKAGPFVFEHSNLTENCLTCHTNHGSMVNNLLQLPVVFLCKECHEEPHTVYNAAESTGRGLERKSSRFTRCTDCHSQHHGSDIPGGLLQ